MRRGFLGSSGYSQITPFGHPYRRCVTPHGETLLSNARRLLELNDGIFQTLRESQTPATIRLELQGEHFLSDILRRFVQTYPRVQLGRRQWIRVGYVNPNPNSFPHLCL